MFGNTVIVQLVELVCCNCTTHFAIDQALYARLTEQGGKFYCPNGHGQHFAETEVSRLKKLNENLKKNLGWAETSAQRANERAEQAKREKTALKSQLTKTRNRIANGVCPCCNRSFTNVARHMTSKHPGFKKAVS